VGARSEAASPRRRIRTCGTDDRGPLLTTGFTMRLPTNFHTAALGLLVLLALPASLHAQESTTRGFVVGLHATGATLTVEDGDRADAGGGGLFVGYGLNRRFTLFAQVDGARFDEQSTGAVEGDWTLGHFDLGLRFNFANSLRSWIPFLQASLGRRAVNVVDPIVDGTAEEEVDFSGGSLTLGGGISYYLSRSWSIEAALLFTGGEFTTLRVDDVSISGFDEDATSRRFNLGVRWWP